MNTLKTICLLVGLVALVSANSGPRPMSWSEHKHRNSLKNSLKPTEWLSTSELESLPSLNAVTLKRLEEMSLPEGANLLNKMCKYLEVLNERAIVNILNFIIFSSNRSFNSGWPGY